jgi:hypothetical protein
MWLCLLLGMPDLTAIHTSVPIWRNRLSFCIILNAERNHRTLASLMKLSTFHKRQKCLFIRNTCDVSNFHGQLSGLVCVATQNKLVVRVEEGITVSLHHNFFAEYEDGYIKTWWRINSSNGMSQFICKRCVYYCQTYTFRHLKLCVGMLSSYLTSI